MAAADSLNPSTVIPSLYLATGPRPTASVLGFAAGFFTVNLAGGMAAFILGHRLAAFLPRPGEDVRHSVEVALGTVALGVAALLWHRRRRVSVGFEQANRRMRSVAPLAGATIALVELPTAFPYLAVVAAVAGSGAGLGAALAMLVLFNVVFLAPAFLFVVARAAAGQRAIVAMERARASMVRHAGALIAGIVLALGLVLLCIGTIGLATAA